MPHACVGFTDVMVTYRHLRTVRNFLSRMPLPSKNTEEEMKEDIWVAIVEEAVCRDITRDEWKIEQVVDETLR
ncbi:hypothetical protein NDU88_007165 [Pleurodeles waltl]|uniref:Uncharacterized protein n=1 Tax=Pleurodeles waltl TaxID=8319 RepID=A0AAV7RU80_PLEWA|nr:hypothetical protein NDU88_007165 [Pleurodeles waltl]